MQTQSIYMASIGEFKTCGVIIILLLNVLTIHTTSSEGGECFNLNGTQTCHSKSSDPYRYYGTKTSYHIAVSKNGKDDLETKGCTPKVFYLYSRHATRYPSEDTIIDMLERLPILHEAILNASQAGIASICMDDIAKFRSWSETLKPSDDSNISPSGEREAASLGQRYKERFPSILKQKYSPEKFVFEYTSRVRTRNTAESFAKGLFGKDSELVQMNGNANDEVIQFHKECDALKKRCKDKSLDIFEVKKFEKSPMMKKLVESVSQRLGFNVSSADVVCMYKACMYGYALETDDIWCAMFSSEELKVLEYSADIDDYYKDAYGNAINHEQACPVAKYIVDLFNSSATTEDKAVFQFSHAGAVKKVYSMFGLSRDSTPLTADNVCSLKDRRWRSSLLAPFNSNIAFVLYQCGAGQKVAAFLNEKSVLLDGCSSELCPLEEFYAKYSPIAESCDINGLCCTCCVH